MRQAKIFFLVFGFFIYSKDCVSQTKINLKDQTSTVDFENALYTKPLRIGATLPANCRVGELFYLSTATQGNNIYGCATADIWSLQGGLAAGPTGALLTSNGTQTQWVGLNGDLAGTPSALQVSGLRNRPLSQTAPTTAQVLSWDGLEWKPFTLNGAAGTITLKSGTTTVGTRGVISYIAGTGIVNAISDLAGELRVQQSVDTAVVMTKTDFQNGEALRCNASMTANAYSCALNPALIAYGTGMRVFLQPGAANTGVATLNINGLGAVGLRRADGTTELAASDLVAGRMYPLWFDGTRFRLVESVLPMRTSEYCNASATANAYVCSLDPVLGSYSAGMKIFLQAGVTNTGVTTLNVNGVGAAGLRRADGITELVAGDLVAGRFYPLWFDGTRFRMVETPSLPRTSEFCGAISTANAYSCALTPALGAYASGIRVQMLADVVNTGAVTLNVNGLGVAGVRRADGLTELAPGDLEAGSLYPLWHDGTRFRLIETPAPVRATASTRPSCDVTRRGLLWHQFSAAGVKDSLAVCAKDNTDSYAWRGLY